jgi:hypothetical protein
MRNGREPPPDVTRNVPAAAWGPPDVTRNDKGAAHVSCISFGAAFGRLHRGARAIGGQGGYAENSENEGGSPRKIPLAFLDRTDLL